MQAEQLLKVSDVSDRLQISRAHLYRLIQNGSINVIRLGRSVRISQASLDRFIQEQESKTQVTQLRLFP